MATVDLDYKPRQWQKRCHLDRKRFTVLALHRRAGKTELAIMELINAAMRFDKELGLFFYVAPFLKQAKLIAWSRLKQRLRGVEAIGGCVINESELSVTFTHNGAVVRIYGGDNPDGMRGVRLDGAVIDEVAQIKPEVWTDILQPALSDRKGWALFIGTPSGVNLFSELFYRSHQLPDWHGGLWTVYDTDALDPVEVERLRRDMSETSFSREYLCDFTAAGNDQLISLADVEDAARREYKLEDMAYAPRILGVDPARFGDDRSVIFPRQGLIAHPPLVFRGLNNMDLAARVVAKIDSWHPDAVFIDAGAGSGVIDRCRQLGHNVIEVNFGGVATDDQYFNKKAEMHFLMRDWLRAGGAIPNETALKQDLAAPTFDYNKVTNKLMIESKEDIKKRGLPSPDLGDALALTFAQPVGKRTPGIFLEAGGRTRVHDPYDNIGMREGNNRVYDPYD